MHFTDQLHRIIFLPKPPERIISLVPSQTELLVELGLEERIVGVTKFCIHPKHLKKRKTIVGGTKNYRFEVIDSLKPDLIIGNKEENDRESIEKLAEKYPVWMTDIFSLAKQAPKSCQAQRFLLLNVVLKTLSRTIDCQIL